MSTSFPPPSPDVPPLLSLALDAHGGLSRWNRLTRITVHLRVGGNILASRFVHPRTRSLQLTLDPMRPYAVFAAFPTPEMQGVFAGDEVRIERLTGETVQERQAARAHAIGHWRWDDLDLLYFLGYALWNYTTTPFGFVTPGFSFRTLEPWYDGKRWLQRLEVHYPPGFPTHCPVQVFFFDEGGLLQRLDYTADIFGRFVRGAHCCFEHRTFSGLVYPTHRVVYPLALGLTPLPWPSAMEGWIDAVEVEEGQIA